MSSEVLLAVALLVALVGAWAAAGGRVGLALLGWLPCAVLALVGYAFNRFALKPGRPPMIALAGQVVRVFALAVVLVAAQGWAGDSYRSFAQAGLVAFAVVWLAEILDLVLRSFRDVRGQK